MLGPNGDATAPSPKQQQAGLDYQYYGTYMLRQRCEDFVSAMGTAVSAHEGWRDIGDAGVASAKNHVER